jgi:hypothetical protein
MNDRIAQRKSARFVSAAKSRFCACRVSKSGIPVDAAMMLDIEKFFSELPSEIRSVGFHGEGDHFSASADLARLSEINASAGLLGSRAFHGVLDRTEDGRAPWLQCYMAP